MHNVKSSFSDTYNNFRSKSFKDIVDQFYPESVPDVQVKGYVTDDGELVSPSRLPVRLEESGLSNRYKLQKRCEWRSRLALECKGRKDVWFVTLTYNQFCCKKEPDIRDIQLFLKRLRSRFVDYALSTRDRLPFKYFFVPEFGDKYGRLHWHGIVFGLPKILRDMMCNPKLKSDGTLWMNSKGQISNIWNYGFVTCKPVTPGRIGYCVKYMYKDMRIERPLKSDNIGNTLTGTTEKDRLRVFFIRSQQPYFHLGKSKYRVKKKVLEKYWSQREGIYIDYRHPDNRPFNSPGNNIRYGALVPVLRYGLYRDDTLQTLDNYDFEREFVKPFNDSYHAVTNIDGYEVVVPTPSDYYDYIFNLNNCKL